MHKKTLLNIDNSDVKLIYASFINKIETYVIDITTITDHKLPRVRRVGMDIKFPVLCKIQQMFSSNNACLQPVMSSQELRKILPLHFCMPHFSKNTA